MSSFFILLFLCLTLINNFHLSEARHVKNLPSAVVVGTVYCDTCFQQDFTKNTHFISGASVAVKCGEENSKPEFYQEVKTNKNGEFKVHLPFSVGKHVKKIEKCSVKLISSNEPYCAVASTATSSTLHLKSRKEGIHIFSAGFFSFKPQNQPNLCNQKPSIQNSKEFNSKKILEFANPSFSPPLQDLTIPDLPQNPLMPNLPPLPQLPPLPNLPSLPPLLPPLPSKTSTPATTALKNNLVSDKKEANPDFFFPPPVLPPLTFQPPPLLPPLPFQPPPSPLIPPVLPPNPLQPPSSPSPSFPIPIPPVIPGLNPPPSSSPPSFPIPIPPVIPGLNPPPSSTPSSFPVPLPPVPVPLPPLPVPLPPAPVPLPPLPVPLPPVPVPLPPGIPGIPPASSSSFSKATSPP